MLKLYIYTYICVCVCILLYVHSSEKNEVLLLLTLGQTLALFNTILFTMIFSIYAYTINTIDRVIAPFVYSGLGNNYYAEEV